MERKKLVDDGSTVLVAEAGPAVAGGPAVDAAVRASVNTGRCRPRRCRRAEHASGLIQGVTKNAGSGFHSRERFRRVGREAGGGTWSYKPPCSS